MGRRNPLTDWAQFFLGERYPWRNHASQIWWRSLKGFRGSCGSNFSISHWLCWSSLQHSHTTVSACEESWTCAVAPAFIKLETFKILWNLKITLLLHAQASIIDYSVRWWTYETHSRNKQHFYKRGKKIIATKTNNTAKIHDIVSLALYLEQLGPPSIFVLFLKAVRLGVAQ